MIAEEASVDNLVAILRSFGLAFDLEINWHKNMVYWCGQGIWPGWVEIFPWKWAANGDLFKLFDTPFGLHLEFQNVDQYVINMVKAKLRYWSSTQLSLVGRILIVNQMLISSLWYFIVV